MIEVLLETSEILAVNKPEGVPTIPGSGWTGPTARSEAEAILGRKLYVVHRLDKETSGVVVFAKDSHTHRFLNEQFSRREVRKTYHALVHGVIAASEGEIRLSLREFGSGRVAADPRGKQSLTRYTVFQRLGSSTLVAAYPQTGRRHQVRAHFYSIGHPIVGDTRYGRRDRPNDAPRLMLHAVSITLEAAPGAEVTIEAPIPESFRRVVERFATSIEARPQGR
jgi:RluA family pseudouridine synthase